MSTPHTPGTIVATGTSSGFGRLTAGHLLDHPDVHLLTHHRTRGLEPRERLLDEYVDLSDLRLVAAWTDRIRDRLADGDLPPLTAIVANAGVQVRSGPRASAQGFELTFAVNHLAHVLLVDRLADLLVPGGRIVVTSSGTHRGELLSRAAGVPGPRLEDAARMADPASVGSATSEGTRRYATSKLCNALHVVALADERPDLDVVAFDPGIVPATGLLRDASAPMQALSRRLTPLLRLLPGANEAAVSARVLADLAAGDTTVPSGSYVEAGRGLRPATAEARDLATARTLLADSRDLVAQAVAEHGHIRSGDRAPVA